MFYSKNKSFTLIELLVVISVIGLLTSIVLVRFKEISQKARIAKSLEISQTIHHSLGSEAVGVWDFDNCTAQDSSGYGNNGTISGAACSPDTPYSAVGQGGGKNSLGFDGVGDYVGVGNGTIFDFSTNDFTISVWAKAIVGITGRGIINKGGWGSVGYAIQEAYSPANRYYFVVRDSAGYKAVALPLYQTWDWTHIVCIKTTNHLEVWINGAMVNQYNGVIGSLSNPTRNLEIGRSFNPYYFNGFIDDVRIYSQALSQSQIQQHYVEGLKTHNNLVLLDKPE